MVTFNEQMQRIFQMYGEEGNTTPASLDEVSAWAINQGLWHPKPRDMKKLCAKDLAIALRQEYFTDHLGRKVRAKHAVRKTENGKQMSFWGDLRDSPREHMELAFAQRRKGIVSDCRQLQIDAECYNALKSNEKPIQMIFDLRRDLEELEMEINQNSEKLETSAV